MSVRTGTRETKSCKLKPYCHFASDSDMLEITEWENGEGVDVTVINSGPKTISLTHGEAECFMMLYNFKEKL